ncbi:MAG TPA: ribosome biogenesis factor YjgA [Stenotrophobium sp.]|jgi:ribosome-associated protein|nr:ribosome biogenesis factor YjgA [Stenotrophobium sp.]
MRKRDDFPDTADDDTDEGPSKTQIKNAMLDLQALGLSLLQLTDPQLDELVTDETLRGALHDLRRIKSHSAHKRQVQYVGKLLRDFDVAPFRTAVATLQAGKARDARDFQVIEHWRERLLSGDAGWTEWIAAQPAGNTKALQSLVREARHEHATAADGKGRAYRELFRQLRSVLQAQPDTVQPSR